MKSILQFTFLLLLYNTLCMGTIHHVPANYSTIQAALNACMPYDTVLVQPGSYSSTTIIWPTSVNGIKLLSAGNSSNTTITSGGVGRVMQINSNSIDTNTVIRGFTITGGYISSGSGYGAGLYVNNASVTLDDVMIIGNRVFVPGGHAHGAGLNLTNSSSRILNSFIQNNSIDSATWCYGAGVYVSGGNPVFRNVEINSNVTKAENWCYGVGIYVTSNSNIRLEQVKINGNSSGNNAIWFYGTGGYFDDSQVTMVNVLVASNKSGAGGSFNYGGGLYFDGVTDAMLMNVTVTDNTKTGNASINGTGIYSRDATVTIVNSILYNTNQGAELSFSTNAVITAFFSNIRGGFSGLGNINVIPGFVSATDFHLTMSSPCAGVGTDNGAPFVDLDGNPRPLPALTMPDMGCYEVNQVVSSLEDQMSSADLLNIYPNPASSKSPLYIQNPGEWLRIIDLTGRVVYQTDQTNKLMTADITGLLQGSYLILTPMGNRKLLVVE
jgi:hypothetical protein